MPLFGLLFVAVVVVGHIGKEVVERKCEVEYFSPANPIAKVTYFFALHPVEGVSDWIGGLASGWDKTCGQVQFKHDLARRSLGR